MSIILYVQAGQASGDGSADNPFGSIQDAIDAAPAGATIRVAEGTYSENLVFRTSGTETAPITLAADGAPGAVVIQPADQSKDTIRVSGADHIVVSGFTLHGSDDPSRQVVQIHAKTQNTDPAEDITLSDNIIVRGAGDGIKVSKSTDITLIDNHISGGGTQESAIDFVGVTEALVTGNTISGIPNIGLMIKGGSSDVTVTGNDFSTIGKSAVEIGGYTPQKFYPNGFLEAGNAYEAANVLFAENNIDDVQGTAIRIIGAQDVIVEANTVTNAAAVVKIDDSAKFHELWFADRLGFVGNDFDASWLIDRSDHANIDINVVSGDADHFDFSGTLPDASRAPLTIAPCIMPLLDMQMVDAKPEVVVQPLSDDTHLVQDDVALMPDDLWI